MTTACANVTHYFHSFNQFGKIMDWFSCILTIFFLLLPILEDASSEHTPEVSHQMPFQISFSFTGLGPTQLPFLLL